MTITMKLVMLNTLTMTMTNISFQKHNDLLSKATMNINMTMTMSLTAAMNSVH